jgi:D-proline reductase (dithiol) PrdB
VGLIQRAIERQGISTIGISIIRRFTEKVKPPRTIFLDWPFGHPLGEPFNLFQQRTVLMAAFSALYSITTPGQIVDLPFKWKQQS